MKFEVGDLVYDESFGSKGVVVSVGAINKKPLDSWHLHYKQGWSQAVVLTVYIFKKGEQKHYTHIDMITRLTPEADQIEV